jgi:N6-L-threonylcarbamoyladenine synthase
VPEIASRAHVEKISGVISAAVDEAVAAGGISGLSDVDAVAVTYGPGLAPALLVGLNAAKGLAMSLGVPLIGVNHIEAHLHTPFLESGMRPEDAMPALGLAVSGGHTSWIDMPEYGTYSIIGQTLDDAAGEAFDKAAKLLGLGYPGGPVIDRMAKEYAGSDFIAFPKGRPRPGTAALAGLDADLCTSFSGLKTALLNYVRGLRGDNPDAPIPDIPRICASLGMDAVSGQAMPLSHLDTALSVMFSLSASSFWVMPSSFRRLLMTSAMDLFVITIAPPAFFL